MSRGVLVGVAAACAAILVVVVVALGLGWLGTSTPPAASFPSGPLVVSTSLAPSTIFFGDPVTARVRVNLDTSTIAPGSVQLATSFEPFVASRAPTVTRTRAGRLETIVYTFALQCVTDGCLPTAAVKSMTLPPVTATAQTQPGSRVTVRKAWPQLLVASRLQRSGAGSTSLRAASTLPAPQYAISPTLLADILVAVAALLCIVAAALAALEIRRAVRRRDRRRRRSPLEVAIDRVRDASARRDVEDRRKALELLAEALSDDGRTGLAGSAERLAWAEPPPSPEGSLALADAAEAAEPPPVEVPSVEVPS